MNAPKLNPLKRKSQSITIRNMLQTVAVCDWLCVSKNWFLRFLQFVFFRAFCG